MRINKRVVIDIESNEVLDRESYEYKGPVARAVAGTAISRVAEWDGKGGRMEWWTATVDPGSIAAGAQEIETFAITGARAGDPVWASLRAPVANLIMQGAAVTANDVVSVYMANNITVTTALDSTAVVVDMLILKRTIP